MFWTALSTERLKIVPLDPVTAYLTRRRRWFADKDVVRYSELRHGTIREFPGSLWAINADIHIGNLGVEYDIPNQTADLSILIGEKDYWGKGYGLEAWSIMLGHLLETYRKVTAGTMAVNVPMLRVFEKSGMEIEGVRKRHFLFEGQEVDLIMAAKFR